MPRAPDATRPATSRSSSAFVSPSFSAFLTLVKRTPLLHLRIVLPACTCVSSLVVSWSVGHCSEAGVRSFGCSGVCGWLVLRGVGPIWGTGVTPRCLLMAAAATAPGSGMDRHCVCRGRGGTILKTRKGCHHEGSWLENPGQVSPKLVSAIWCIACFFNCRTSPTRQGESAKQRREMDNMLSKPIPGQGRRGRALRANDMRKEARPHANAPASHRYG